MLPGTAALAYPTDCFFAFNGVACEIAASDFVRQSGCVYACLYVDHPVHQLPRLTHDINKQVLFFLDRTHVQFMTAWGCQARLRPPGVLAPGGQ